MYNFPSWWLQHTMFMWPDIALSVGHVSHYMQFVSWNFRLFPFIFILRIVKYCVQKGTDLCAFAFCDMFLILKEDPQAVSRASWISSITVSMHGAAATLWLRCSSSPSLPSLPLCIPLRRSSTVWMRLPLKFAMILCSSVFLTPPFLFPVGWIKAFALPRLIF